MSFYGMDTEQGQAFAQLLADRRSDVEERRDAIDNVIQGIEDIWQGTDAEAFRDAWNGIRTGQIERLVELLMDMARDISDQAQAQDFVSAADALSAAAEAMRDIFRPGNVPFENPLTAFQDWRNYLTGALGAFTGAGDDMLKEAWRIYAKGGEGAVVPWLRNAYALKSAGKVLGPVGNVLTAGFAAVDRWNEDASDPSLSTGERAARAGIDAAANVGGAGLGAWGGAAGGAALGTMICPGVGTVIGGVVGGIAGGIAGGGAADAAVDWLLG